VGILLKFEGKCSQERGGLVKMSDIRMEGEGILRNEIGHVLKYGGPKGDATKAPGSFQEKKKKDIHNIKLTTGEGG